MSVALHGNLSNRMIRSRDNASADLSDNVAEMGEGAWFVDPAAGNLHLSDCAAPGEAALHPEVEIDIDGDQRTDPTVPGADQCG